MKFEITEKMREQFRKGRTVLKVSRTRSGAVKGAVGAGITFLVFGLVSGLPFLISGMLGGMIFLVTMGVPGLIFLVAGKVMQARRGRDYLKFYGEESGYDEAVLRQAEQELLMPQAVAVGGAKTGISCYITENFLVSVTKEACYVRMLSDLCAAFYSERIPGDDGRIRGMVFISRQDIAREPQTNSLTYRQCGGYINALLDREACALVTGEIQKHNPAVIVNQIFSDGQKTYDLLSLDRWTQDWEAILRVRR